VTLLRPSTATVMMKKMISELYRKVSTNTSLYLNFRSNGSSFQKDGILLRGFLHRKKRHCVADFCIESSTLKHKVGGSSPPCRIGDS